MGEKVEFASVFEAEKDYPCCRIPSLITSAKGTLLAFCEGRQSRNDHAENDIVVKRSLDGGDSWSAASIVASEGTDSLNDPSVVVDRNSGNLVLHYSRFVEGYHTDKAVPGYTDPNASRNYVTISKDDGVSWSAPLDVTEKVKRPDVRAAVVTCGVGIQLRRGEHVGRLVHAVYQFGGTVDREAYVCFSDDGGASWDRGELVLAEDGDRAGEPQVVELADGRVMMNTRTRNKLRKVAISEDGGATFGNFADDPVLIEPACQGSILRYSDPLDGEPSRILFSNPASQTERANGTVRLSLDEGATWVVSKQLYAGSFAYSCLAVLPDGKVGCLFEADDYQRIALARFSLDWLESR